MNQMNYINLSWAVVGICEGSHKPLSFHIPDIDKDEKKGARYLDIIREEAAREGLALSHVRRFR